MVAVTFFGGIQLLTLGVIGEFIGRMSTELKERPIYIIDIVEECGFARRYVRCVRNTYNFRARKVRPASGKMSSA